MTDQERAAQAWNEAKIEHTKYIGLARNRNAAVIIATYGQERYRAGMEKTRDAILQGLLAEFYLFKKGKPITNVYDVENIIHEIIDGLIAEQEKK